MACPLWGAVSYRKFPGLWTLGQTGAKGCSSLQYLSRIVCNMEALMC